MNFLAKVVVLSGNTLSWVLGLKVVRCNLNWGQERMHDVLLVAKNLLEKHTVRFTHNRGESGTLLRIEAPSNSASKRPLKAINVRFVSETPPGRDTVLQFGNKGSSANRPSSLPTKTRSLKGPQSKHGLISSKRKVTYVSVDGKAIR